MILENLDAWITIGANQRLTEYARVRPKTNTVECWIPSVEGENFAVNWDLVKRSKRAKFGLRSELWLDGTDVGERLIMPASSLSSGGESGLWDYVGTNNKGKRKFLFGKLQLTDQEDLAPLNDPKLEYLNTIKLKLTWIKGCKKVYHDKDSESSDSGGDQEATASDARSAPPVKWVNEQMVKKGHGGSAELGPLIPKPPRANTSKGKKKKKERTWHWSYRKAADPPPLYFIFHYAPKDWLQDREIIRKSITIPAVDLSNTELQSQPTHDETVDALQNRALSPTPYREQETTTPTNNLPREHSLQPKAEPLTSTAQEELLLPPHQGTGHTDNAIASDQDNPMDRDEKAHLLSLMHPSTNSSQLQQPSAGSLILSAKREREPTPPSFEVISSDDEIVVLEIKPPKQMTTKRPRIKYEGEDLKPVTDVLERKPTVPHQEIDTWRLGC
ncbi:hypothetical protein FRC09_009602 [Ceratobasidium sp. 395]|nr:hypothetical protein FRC09_009602 [Ceratobasidium sp. 395]